MKLIDVYKRQGVDAPFEVAQHHPVGRLGDEILRRHRDLSAAAGRIDTEGGNGQARGVSPQVLDHFYARRHRRSDVYKRQISLLVF